MPLFTYPKSFRNAHTEAHFHLESLAGNGLHQTILLDQAASPRHNSHPALPHLTLLVFEAVLEVVCVSLPGYIVARQGMFTTDMQKFTANLNVALFTPCLIFVKLASKLTLHTMIELAIIPLIFIAQTLVSYLCSLLISKAFRFAKRQRNFVVAMGVFGNSNSLPISLVISLSKTISGLHWDKVPNDSDGEVQARGILYLLVFQQLGQILRWSWGYNVLLAPLDLADDSLETRGSRLERGQASASEEETGSSEERQRFLDYAFDSEDEEDDASCSESTRVEASGRSHRSLERSAAASKFPSGDQTPVTYQEDVSPSSNNNNKVIRTGGLSRSKSSILGSQTAADTDPDLQDLPKTQAKVVSCFRRFKQSLTSHLLQLKTASSAARKNIFHAIRKTFSQIFKSFPIWLQKGICLTSRYLRTFGAGVWAFMNPPLWAMLAAILVASIPDLQHIFFADGTLVRNSVTSAISQNGNVAVPLILVVLGGNLARNTIPSHDAAAGDEDRSEEAKLVFASIMSRMVLPFCIMAPLLAITAKYAPVSILDDPIFVIVCFLITGAPSALQLAQICQINNVFVGAMTRLLFQSYVVWILPSTLILVICALEVVEWAKQ